MADRLLRERDRRNAIPKSPKFWSGQIRGMRFEPVRYGMQEFAEKSVWHSASSRAITTFASRSAKGDGQ